MKSGHAHKVLATLFGADLDCESSKPYITLGGLRSLAPSRRLATALATSHSQAAMNRLPSVTTPNADAPRR